MSNFAWKTTFYARFIIASSVLCGKFPNITARIFRSQRILNGLALTIQKETTHLYHFCRSVFKRILLKVLIKMPEIVSFSQKCKCIFRKSDNDLFEQYHVLRHLINTVVFYVTNWLLHTEGEQASVNYPVVLSYFSESSALLWIISYSLWCVHICIAAMCICSDLVVLGVTSSSNIITNSYWYLNIRLNSPVPQY